MILNGVIIDNSNRPFYISEDDICVYAREHYSGGYEKSESNQFLFNFKKPVKYKNQGQWYYKLHSIALFGSELNCLKFPRGSVLIPSPTSKPKNSNLYDSRIVDSIKELMKYNSNVILQDILDVTQEIPAAHSEGGSRSPDEIIPYLSVADFYGIKIPERVFIIDDIVTTGGHFNAAKAVLKQKYPKIKVIGVFWALHLFDDKH